MHPNKFPPDYRRQHLVNPITMSNRCELSVFKYFIVITVVWKNCRTDLNNIYKN